MVSFFHSGGSGNQLAEDGAATDFPLGSEPAGPAHRPTIYRTLATAFSCSRRLREMQGLTKTAPQALNDFIEAFETAQARGETPALAAFLPEAPHPLYRAVLSELIRVDLEYSWKRGRPKRVEDYRLLFPDLFEDAAAARAIAFEEYRLRRQAGGVGGATDRLPMMLDPRTGCQAVLRPRSKEMYMF
jgi:hypothetical protein